MPKSQLSVRGQVGLTLGVLLFFSLAITFAGYMASGQTQEKLAAFASDGATVTGEVTNKYIHSVSKNWVYWVDVRFKALDGRVYNMSDQVPNTIYDGLEVGDQVPVTYDKAKPEWFYVAGNAPTERDVAISQGMFQYGLVASLLFLISVIAFICWPRGPATPSNAGIASGASQEFTFRPPQTRPGTGFGMRGQ